MIAVDTNVLVYAHREEAPFHAEARARLVELAESSREWAIPWPCVQEFISTVTRSVFDPPSTIDQAFDAVESWLSAGTLHLIGEGDGHLTLLRQLASAGKAFGPAIHDARIAAICMAHGVTELWTADRDFSRFPDLKTVNPLVA